MLPKWVLRVIVATIVAELVRLAFQFFRT